MVCGVLDAAVRACAPGRGGGDVRTEMTGEPPPHSRIYVGPNGVPLDFGACCCRPVRFAARNEFYAEGCLHAYTDMDLSRMRDDLRVPGWPDAVLVAAYWQHVAIKGVLDERERYSRP